MNGAARATDGAAPIGGAHLTVVGIGADGWTGLGEAARAAVLDATLLVGSQRQLALIPATAAQRLCWPSPIDPLVDALVAATSGPACVLASGDPMLHGIGATLAGRVEPERLTVLPAPSSFSLACARLGWPGAETELVSLVARPAETLVRWLQPRRRLIAYTHGSGGADEIARLLCGHGLGLSEITVLERLGARDEQIVAATAEHWQSRAPESPYLVAVDCRAEPGAMALALTPGLPDGAYESDGQLTKREVRAITLATLAPLPSELLWDVGAGSGSIAIEWLRAEPTARAIAIEALAERAERIARNAHELGVPRLEIRCGRAPAALADLDRPDAIFVGGGLTEPGLLSECWERLAPGGRIAANAVTLEGEQRLAAARQAQGGTLVRIAIGRAEPIGRFTGWRSEFPVVQWTACKEQG